MRDAFKGYMIVLKGTTQPLHWVVYHSEEVAMTEALEWLTEDQFELKEIMRRMR